MINNFDQYLKANQLDESKTLNGLREVTHATLEVYQIIFDNLIKNGKFKAINSLQKISATVAKRLKADGGYDVVDIEDDIEDLRYTGKFMNLDNVIVAECVSLVKLKKDGARVINKAMNVILYAKFSDAGIEVEFKILDDTLIDVAFYKNAAF